MNWNNMLYLPTVHVPHCHTQHLQVQNEFYQDTQGVLLVYDVTHRASFEVLGEWLVEMRSHLSNPSDMDSVAVAVCANKVWCICSTVLYNVCIGQSWSHSSVDPFISLFTNWARTEVCEQLVRRLLYIFVCLCICTYTIPKSF